MIKYRPKEYVMYCFGALFKTYISCYPQQKWELVSTTDEKAVLRYKNVTIEIEKSDFKKHWVEVKNGAEN